MSILLKNLLYEYITRNLPNLNWNILPQIFEENEVELTEEIRAYLKETPKNTNWNVLNRIGGKSQEETWPKLIHVIYDSGWKMANDSDFSTFAEAYNFIRNKWDERNDGCTTEYIGLKVIDSTIEIKYGHAFITGTDIDWYESNNPTIYRLSENNFKVLDDN